jgi:NAD(P)H dehydrogenase (quinone)
MLAVSGASGQLGALVVEEVLRRVDAGRVVGLSRTPDRVAGLGIEARYADFDEPGSLVAAFDGVERLLMISLGAYDGPPPGHAHAIAAAAKAGVGHVIYTSFARAGEPGQPHPLIVNHRETERMLAESGLAFTALRFNQWPEMWTYAGVAQAAVRAGELVSSGGEGRVGHVTRPDSAAVAAAVLASGGNEGQLIEVTGPAAVTEAEVAAALGVRHEAVDDAEAAEWLARQGLPDALVQGWLSTSHLKREGWYDVVTHAVERLAGRKPTSIEDFFAAQALW